MSVPARTVDFASALAALAAAASVACSPEPGGFLGPAPAQPPIHLVETKADAIASREASVEEPLLQLDRRELAAWTVTEDPDGIRYASPPLSPRGVPGAGRLLLRLRPGGARHLSVVPYVRGTQLSREQRALRRLELSFEPGSEPDAPIDVSIDLHEALHGSFGDAGRGGRLASLEIGLAGARRGSAELLSLAIEPRRLLPPGAAAASLVVDHHGVLRPAWALRGGAQVDLAVRVPAGRPELRWTDAALAGTGARVVEVVHAGRSEPLASAPPVDGVRGRSWTPARSDLARWAGRAVRIRLRVEGDGVGLFGDPVVSVPDPESRTPDVLVVLIDTLRADHLGVGGSALPGVSPNIDRLAREGVWFGRAQSSSPWTKPAIASLMSGVLPPTHRVGATSYTDRMPASVPLLQERFRAAGWRTGSFSASPLGSTLSALERGFEAAYPPRFWRTRARLDLNPSADQLGEALLEWIEEQPDRPFFAYLHTLEVHEWKLARYRTGRPEKFTAYDAAILDADRQLGALVEALERRGRPFRLVVTSDHGESWGDHGLPSHGFGLYQSQIHIPLLFYSSDGLVPRTVGEPVSLADLGPTLLDGFGLPELEESDGVSLLPALRGDAVPARPILSALIRFVWAPDAPRQYAVTTPDQRVLIRRDGDPLTRAFDLVVDPRELQPLAPPDPALEATLDELLEGQQRRAARFRERHGTARPGVVTLDDAERLRALGYLDDSAAAP